MADMAGPIDSDSKERLRLRLEKARDAALEYLSGYLPNDLMEIMDAIDEDLESLDCWDDENNRPEFGYSQVDLLQQLDYKAGAFMFEGEKLYDIDVMAIFATFAYVKAIEGIGILKGSSDIARYTLAVESCIDAFDALHYGKYAQKRAENEGSRILEAERLSNWSATATAARNQKRYEEEDGGGYIVSCFEDLCETPEDTLLLEMPSQLDPSKKKIKKYIIRSDGQMNVDICAKYIFHIAYEIPSRLGKVTSSDRQIRYIKRMIKNHIFGEGIDTNAQDKTFEALVDRRVFPKKAEPQPVTEIRPKGRPVICRGKIIYVSIPTGTITPPKK